MGITILLAEDHQIMREGLRAMFEKQPGMEVVGEAADGRIAVQLARKISPDVVIMDIGMAELNGIEATRYIVAESKNIKVIALSMHSDRQIVAEMLRAGASGYLVKGCAFEELCRAIRSVVANQIYLSPGITDVVVEDYVRHLSAAEPAIYAILSPRERETLQLLAEGKPTKQIASLLHVSVKTIETYRRQIMNRLDIHSLPELTKYAIREGLTSLDN
ncbi:response regulator [Candidatus Poribacteria bacterium]